MRRDGRLPRRRQPRLRAGRVLRAVRHVHRAGGAHASPTSPAPSSSPIPTVPDVLDAVADRRRRLRRRADRELDRGGGQLHPGRARLRLRPADRRARSCSTSSSASSAPAGLSVDDVKVVLSIPVATAQCHRFLREHLPRRRGASGALSTAEAARLVAEGDGTRTERAWRVVAAGRRRAATGSRCSRPTSPTTRQPDPVRRSSPARACRRRPVTTARRWSSTSAPTSRAA